MTKKIVFALGFLSAAVIPGTTWAEALVGNCQSTAQLLATGDSARSVTLVREWSESILTPVGGELVVSSGWLDRQTGLGGETNYWGVSWLYATVEKGKDYVMWLDKGSTGNIILQADGLTYSQMQFESDFIDGITYYHIDAGSWQNYHADTKYYIRIFGGPNTVDKTAKINFRQTALKDIIPHDKGSASDPYDIDVSKSGSSSVYNPPEEQYGRLATVYRAALKANETYTFEVTYVAENMGGAILMLPEGVKTDDIPGTISIAKRDDDNNVLALTITVTKDYSFAFAVGMWPTDDAVAKLDVAGAKLSWKLASEEPDEPDEPDEPIDPPAEDPQVVSSGVFSGALPACDLASGQNATTLVFYVEASVLDTAATNFTATLSVGDSVVACSNTGNGAILQGEEPYQSCLELAIAADGKALSVYGAVYVNQQEYVVDGVIGVATSGDYAFAEVDAMTMSAEQMGITNGAFAAEAAGSETLVRLQAWGEKYGLKVACANDASFSDTGSPAAGNLVAAAYLFDCDLNEESIEDAKKGFVITGFDPATGVVTIADDKVDGGRYGNGKIEIRTSTSLDGTYDRSAKASAARLFYRAYLVR